MQGHSILATLVFYLQIFGRPERVVVFFRLGRRCNGLLEMLVGLVRRLRLPLLVRAAWGLVRLTTPSAPTASSPL